MDVKLDKGMVTLIIFIIAATVLSSAQSVVTTGLTDIMADFAVSSTTVQWIYSSFLLVLGVMIPTSAYVTRRFKIKTILVFSLALFTVASLVAYIAPSIEVLIFARVLQAVGSGVLLPIAQIIIFKVIPQEKWQIFMGLFGFIVGIAPALAPTLGGMIIDAYSWREIFLLFAALGLIVLIAAVIFSKFELETSDYPLDIISLILCAVSCVGIMLGFSNIAECGFSLVYVIAPIIIGFICLFVFVKRQLSIEHPLLNLSVIKNKYFVWGTIFSAVLYFTMCGLNVIMPLFVQSVAYHSATTSGLILLPGTIIMIVFNFVGPVLANRVGVRQVLIASSLFSMVGFGLMMTYTVDTSVEYMIITQIIRAIGPGLGLMPAVTWTLGVVSGDVDATAINNTVRQIIGSVGAALAVVLMAAFAGGNVAHNQISANAFSTTSLIMVILSAISLIIVLVYVKEGHAHNLEDDVACKDN